MNKTMLIAFLALLLPLLPACNKGSKGNDEQLKAIEAADRKLLAQEQDLLSRRGNLRRERTRIRDKRASLLTRKLAMGDDNPDGREEIEKEESELASLEEKLMKQEINLNTKLQALVESKNTLVDKLAKDKNATTRETILARREYSVAIREKDISRRESDLARRESDLAHREQSFAKRQARICPKMVAAVPVYQPPPPDKARHYTRKDVEPVYQAALRAMAAKGILTADLPPGVDRLVTDVRHAVSKRQYARARFAADQLLSTVRKMRIDRSFIGAKIGRLSAAMKRRPPRGAKRNKVNTLFQQATANYGDGRFIAANKKLNRIYALIR